jgi:GNAT superfamily N-acetyltransferase
MPACASIVNAWIDTTEWMPRIHPPDDVLDHYQNVVFAEQDVWIAELRGRLAGFMALSREAFVTALYLAENARNMGIGKALIYRGKRLFPAGLHLWTFVANTGAQRFYLREGFQEVRRTDGENEEGLPDILYRWSSAPLRAI